MDIALINGKSFDFYNDNGIVFGNEVIFDIGFIADQLTKVIRFNGNGETTLYHAIAVSDALKNIGCTTEHQLVALLYYATESITGNITPILKKIFIQKISNIEKGLLHKIIKDLNIKLSHPISYYFTEIEKADKWITKLELINLLQRGTYKPTEQIFSVWQNFNDVAIPLSVVYHYQKAIYTPIDYFQLFNELKGKINE